MLVASPRLPPIFDPMEIVASGCKIKLSPMTKPFHRNQYTIRQPFDVEHVPAKSSGVRHGSVKDGLGFAPTSFVQRDLQDSSGWEQSNQNGSCFQLVTDANERAIPIPETTPVLNKKAIICCLKCPWSVAVMSNQICLERQQT